MGDLSHTYALVWAPILRLSDSAVLFSIPSDSQSSMYAANQNVFRFFLSLATLHLNAHLFNASFSIHIDVVYLYLYLCLFNQPTGGGCNVPLRLRLLLLLLLSMLQLRRDN